VTIFRLKNVCSLLACCNQRFYLLKRLRDGGMSPNKLNTAFSSFIINQILYCIAAWRGFLSVDQIRRIDAILTRAWRYHLTGDIYDVVGLLNYVDSRLFKSVQNEHYCLNHLLYRLLNLMVLIFALEGTDLFSLDVNLNYTVNPTFLYVYKISFRLLISSVFKNSLSMITFVIMIKVYFTLPARDLDCGPGYAHGRRPC
jgi:hypothetical protein